VMVFSATNVQNYAEYHNAFASIGKQVVWAAFGFVVFWACQRLPVRTYRFIGGPLLVLGIVLVGVVDLLDLLTRAEILEDGRVGAISAYQNWLYVGGYQLQPSEITKFALLLWGTDQLLRKAAVIGEWRELAVPLFPVTGVLLALVGFNDLGTMLVLLILFVALLWIAGVRLRVFGVMLAVALGGIAALVFSRGYRLERLVSFIDPKQYEQAGGYQAVQGLIAIGQGGWFGEGLGQSRQKWGALPNAHNDFIFAIIAEELGVVGCVLVLALFIVLAYTGLRIARRSDHPFRRLAAGACTMWLTSQAIINIGGVVGLMPITGLPLPFISDGGSALVVTLAAIGMLASFARAEPDAARALHARPPGRVMRLLWAPLPPLGKGAQ